MTGWITWGWLRVTPEPELASNKVGVTITQSGAAPQELETQVTRPVEDAIAGLGRIRHIVSTLTDGQSRTEIEFELGTPLDRAVNDVRDAVAAIRPTLPRDIEEPLIRRIERDDGFFMDYMISSPQRSVKELSEILENQISRALLAVPGIAQIAKDGEAQREVRVWLNPARLEALGITATEVNTQLRNLNVNLAGGRNTLGTQEQAVRVLGSATTIEQLQATPIRLPHSQYVRLENLGRVEDSIAEVRQGTYVNGRPVVAFFVKRSPGSSMLAVEKGVQAKIKLLAKTLPSDLTIEQTWTYGNFVRESYDASLEALLLGAGLAMVVIGIFLKDWRATLIAAIAMPLSVIPTFGVMYLAGFTLNSMTLLALALVVGILVDDAIVEIENIVRFMGMGKTPFTAALEAADEIGLAVLATTMTIVVVFIPVTFMEGTQGQYFREFGWTVAAAVLFSLLVARLLTPLMAAYLLKTKPLSKGAQESWFLILYQKLLSWALHHRGIVLVVGLLFFGSSLWLWQQLPTSLIDKADDSEIYVGVELSPGDTVKDTEKVIQQMNHIILKHPEVRLINAFAGNDYTRTVHTGYMFVYLKPITERTLTEKQVREILRSELTVIPGVRINFGGGGFSGNKEIEIVLKSSDTHALEQSATGLTDQMRNLPGLVEVQTSRPPQRPELRVYPDVLRAADQGVTVTEIARMVRLATLGDVEANLPKFNLSDRQIPIRVQIDPQFRNDLQALGKLLIRSERGQLVPLQTVARLEISEGAAKLDRFDRERNITITANLKPGIALGNALTQVRSLPALKNLPSTVQEQAGGDIEAQADVFNGFGGAIIAAIVLVYGVLVLLFNDPLQPVTILISLPLALGGAILGLLLAGKTLGLYALIGMVLLLGLVTKNAILLVEYAIVAMQQGKLSYEAITQAGKIRLQPILMTTVAMIAGMLPIALSIGVGTEARSPMAVAVVGGLLTSTFLTLVVVPVVLPT